MISLDMSIISWIGFPWLFRCVNSVPIQAYMHLLFPDMLVVVATRTESGKDILTGNGNYNNDENQLTCTTYTPHYKSHLSRTSKPTIAI
jgi:hypothetical protein